MNIKIFLVLLIVEYLEVSVESNFHHHLLNHDFQSPSLHDEMSSNRPINSLSSRFWPTISSSSVFNTKLGLSGKMVERLSEGKEQPLVTDSRLGSDQKTNAQKSISRPCNCNQAKESAILEWIPMLPPVSLTPTTPSPPPPSPETPQVSEVCGQRSLYSKKRIVGGSEAAFSEWPWMISLRKNGHHKCGAVLVNKYWALTAAHCVYKNRVSDFTARLGEHDTGHESEPKAYIERRLILIIVHPHYDPNTDENDLALLRFYQPVHFQDHVIPVCVPSEKKSYANRWGTAAGWGKIDDGSYPKVLQKVDLPIISNVRCMRMFRKAGFVEHIPHSFLCAGFTEGGKDSCRGDSGGPLVVEENDRWYVVGITSWGNGCALPNQPGVYTRITSFASWIDGHIGEN